MSITVKCFYILFFILDDNASMHYSLIAQFCVLVCFCCIYGLVHLFLGLKNVLFI